MNDEENKLVSQSGHHVLHSLEMVAEIHGDPTEIIYQTLFANDPDLEALFVIDTDGGVRGAMLQHTFECIMDYFDKDQMASNFIASTRVVHDGYGVPEGKFGSFFVVIRDCCKTILGSQWTDDMQDEWDLMLKNFSNLV